MELIAKVLNSKSAAAGSSKLKFSMSSVFLYHFMRAKLLEEEKEDPNPIWSPFHADNIYGPMAPIMYWYQTFTTLAHITSFSLTLSLIYHHQDHVIRNDSSYLSAIFCHSPRFIVHNIIGPYYMIWLGCSYSVLQLGWRIFLLLDGLLLKLDTFTYLKFDEEIVQSNLDPQEALKSYRSKHKLDLAQRVMFFKIVADTNNAVAIGLRPNRTPEARQKLVFAVNKTYQVCFIVFMIIMAFFAPTTIWTAIYRIDVYYPGCEPSSTFLHTATRSIATIVVSVIILFDCFGVYCFTFPPGLTLIYDLMLYWRKIVLEVNELDRLIRELRYLSSHNMTMELNQKELHLLSQRRMINSYKIFQDHHHLKLPQQQQQKEKQQMSLQVSQIGSFAYLTQSSDSYSLKERIYVFQGVMCDFFERLREIDGYMSQGVTMIFIIWLFINGVVSYIGVQTDTSVSLLLIRFVQFFMVLLFCMYSVLLLYFKSFIDPVYETLNSIMANDPSMDKTRWLYLLKYYTVLPRHSFRLFRYVVFTSNVFFQSFSYTLSYSLYMYNIKSIAQKSDG